MSGLASEIGWLVLLVGLSGAAGYGIGFVFGRRVAAPVHPPTKGGAS